MNANKNESHLVKSNDVTSPLRASAIIDYIESTLFILVDSPSYLILIIALWPGFETNIMPLVTLSIHGLSPFVNDNGHNYSAYLTIYHAHNPILC